LLHAGCEARLVAKRGKFLLGIAKRLKHLPFADELKESLALEDETDFVLW
jgi:hypothetical protein